MAELRKEEDRLKQMSAKKIGSSQQRLMVKRIKQKSRKQAHDPDFEYQPMTKAKEDTRNKTQTAADVPKPTEGTDEEKEKKNEKKKQEIETETEPAIEPEQKEGAHEAKQQQKEKMQEDIGQEKEVIDGFSEMKLALQPSIEEFEKNDLTFARNPYAGRSYVFSTLINH
ncbi:unnamed protein product [Camellia sinensis]